MWLLKQEVALIMQRAWDAGLAPTAEQCAEFVARPEAAAAQSGAPRNYKVAGDVAEIRVEGVLTAKPDFFAWLFGGGNTTYEQIQSALALAESDPSVKRLSLFVDSPGGQVHGLFETLAAIENLQKPITVRASMADSAAYAIAAVAGKIEATNAAAEFGSIGVATAFLRDEEIIDITSTEAPNKRPDPSTEEGKAVIREYLDAIHELFADAIARGRGTTVDDVNANFGRGAVLLAGEAKKRGMIDKIPKPALRAVAAEQDQTKQPIASAADGGAQPRKKRMTEEELRAQHPELYTAVLKKGEEQGTKNERDRVCAHLTLGEQSGDMKTAITAIESGEGMTQTLTAKYLAAGMNRADRATRQEESNRAAQVLEGAKPHEETKDLGDQVAEAMARQRGRKAS